MTSTLEFVDNEFASMKIGGFKFNGIAVASISECVFSSVRPSVVRSISAKNRGGFGIGLQREKQMSVRKRMQTIHGVLKTYGKRMENIRREKNDTTISVTAISFRTGSYWRDDRIVVGRPTSKSVCGL